MRLLGVSGNRGENMSRTVIRDIVIPIVSKAMREQGHFLPYTHFVIEDENLEAFFEEEMRRYFGVIGSNRCQHLKEQLEEAKKNDPDSFEFLIGRLLGKIHKTHNQDTISKESKKILQRSSREGDIGMSGGGWSIVGI